VADLTAGARQIADKSGSHAFGRSGIAVWLELLILAESRERLLANATGQSQ
jgi:hypothetical protein